MSLEIVTLVGALAGSASSVAAFLFEKLRKHQKDDGRKDVIVTITDQSGNVTKTNMSNIKVEKLQKVLKNLSAPQSPKLYAKNVQPDAPPRKDRNLL